MAAPLRPTGVLCLLSRIHNVKVNSRLNVQNFPQHFYSHFSPLAIYKSKAGCVSLTLPNGSSRRGKYVLSRQKSTESSTNRTHIPEKVGPTQDGTVVTSSINGDLNNGRLGHFMQMYEDFVGLTEVKHAQDKVVKAEQQFLQVQEDRRTMQQEITTVQAEVRTLGAELEKTNRTDSKYIDLVKKEHEILLVEKDMTNRIKALDKAERDFFSLLSAAVRESHEKERARAEKTKYWSIIGSVIGAIIGIVGSTVNNHRRMTQMRAILTESGESTAEYKAMTDKLLQTISQNSTSESFHFLQNTESSGVNVQKQGFEPDSFVVSSQLMEKQREEILHSIDKQSAAVISQLDKIHRLVGVQRAQQGETNVVYVGPEIQTMLESTRESLGERMKQNTLASTAAISGVLSIGVLALVYVIRGSS
ncbi:mitochondrial potassium channel-like [Aplysia californica]|uniref:Mitochondrial potassium channel-like n=1 Tax=Aplysia californica TaxID=6500 RepID=A0ABM0K5U5_APLCA|nr:mitochondrial potassium channel-like [Aplysia californica]